MWVPVGLLDDRPEFQVVLHLFLDSKASWESLPEIGACYAETPGLAQILRTLEV